MKIKYRNINIRLTGVKKLFAVVAMMAIPFVSFSQLSTTTYFNKYNPRQHKVNPAFRPDGNYIGFPCLSTFAINAGNSRFSFNDFFVKGKINGEKRGMLFFDKYAPESAIDDFVKQMGRRERVFTSYNIDIIDFGFRTKKNNYYTATISNRFDLMTAVPKQLGVEPLLHGMDKGETYDMKINKLSVDASLYSQLAIGFSRPITDKLTVGAKVKYLYGHANVSTNFKDLRLTASREKWELTGDGSVRAACPGLRFVPKEDGQIDEVEAFEDFDGSYAKPQGHGGALDLGATYQLLPRLQLSASIIDLGFIHWKNNLQELEKKDDIVYDGVDVVFGDDESDFGDYFEVYEDMAKAAYRINETPKAYNRALASKIHLGAEYSFWDDRLGLGILSKTSIFKRMVWEDFTLSANLRPNRFFSMVVTYNMFDGAWNNLGCGMNFNLGAFNLNLAVDNIPLRFVAEDGQIYAPSHTKGITAQVGIAFMFKYKTKDEDGDGVVDKYDKCFGTPQGVEVDEKGCPKDADGDGVPDYLDQCAETPKEAWGLVDTLGCPLDSDGDGVPDYLDKCAQTPKEAWGFVDSLGCPLDSDGDGVYDYIDKCPDTPKEAEGTVDEYGCPRDSDGDGVPNFKDKCPDTPAEANGKVDENGCPKDSDGDGIYDYLDKCPEVPGVKENNGCPEIKAEVKKIFKKALTGIQFETGKSVIKRSSYPILNDVVRIMKENPDYKLSISGYTDNTGSAEKNKKLSEDRALAVLTYLTKHGVDVSRVHSAGYGIENPIASNATPQGRAKNRRVEFEVEF